MIHKLIYTSSFIAVSFALLSQNLIASDHGMNDNDIIKSTKPATNGSSTHVLKSETELTANDRKARRIHEQIRTNQIRAECILWLK